MENWFDLPTTNDAPQAQAGGFDTSALIQSLIQAESSGNPNALGPVTRSGARAQGLMQVMPATGAEVAQRLGMSNYDLMNPDDNRRIGEAYFQQMQDQFKDPEIALAAYNFGPGNVNSALRRSKAQTFQELAQAVDENGKPYLPEETRNYVPKVMGGASQYGAQAQPTPAPSQAPMADNSMDWFNLPDAPAGSQEIALDQIPTQGDYSFDDAAAEVLDYLPFGKKLAAGASAAWNYDTPGQYDYAKQKLDENAQRFRDNAGGWAKAGAFATGVVPQALAIPASASSTLLSPSATGAGLGAGDALDDATLGKDAIAKGVIGGGIGAVGGGVGYGLAGALSKIASSQTAQKTADNLMKIGKGEAGAVNPASAIDSLPDLTKSEAFLTNWAKDAPIEKLQSGVQKIQAGIKENVPVKLAEAVDSPNLYSIADLMANTGKTQEVLRPAYDAGKAGAKTRIQDALLKKLPETYDDAGNVILSDDAIPYALNKSKDILTDQRAKVAEKTYYIARKNAPDYADPALDRILNVPVVRQSLKAEARAQRDLTGQAIEDFNPKNFDTLDKLKRQLFQLETSAKKKVSGGTLKPSDKSAGYFQELRGQLVKATDFPEYQSARATYALQSKPINELIGNVDLDTGKQVKGLFTDLLKIGEMGKPAEAGKKLLSNRPDVIRKIRSAVVRTDPELEGNILSGVRGALENKLNSKRGVTRTIDYIREDGAEALKGAVGQEKYQALKGYIDLEQLVQEGFNRTAPNSKTAGRLIAEGQKEGLLSSIQTILTTNWKSAFLKKVVQDASQPNNVVSMQVAEILADPKMGKATLEKMIAYRNITDPRIANAKKFIDLFVSSKTGGQAGAQVDKKKL